MAPVDVVYYLDVLSSWCFVAERAVERIEQTYGDRVRFDWRIALVYGGGPLPYSHAQLEWYYARTERMTGVRLNAAWQDSPEASTGPANLAVEAARALGADDSRLRRALARAALIDGKPLGRRDRAIEEAARISGIAAGDLDREMRNPHIAERIERSTKEFEARGFPQRPAFEIRNTSGDLATLSGLYTFESLDAVIGEMLHASEITAEIGPEPA